ncbi:trehalose-phosphatase [Nocardia sp. NBC_00511]|uniref:trehalose-phosphatase n=1 Tax=Nocardia sp. NBC_00511 TaxID=2903591 RepID=UPI0030DE42C8
MSESRTAVPLIDSRSYDAVIFDTDGMVADSTAGLERELRAAGLGVRVCSATRDPVMLLAAARRVGADPARTVVVVAAEAGVGAARAGGFGLVIAVDRGDHAAALIARGADAVVEDLAQVRLRAGFQRMSEVPDALDAESGLEVGDTEKLVVLLDFDGTLSEVVPDPGAAVLVDGADQVLARLSKRCPVAVISGRELEDLRDRVGVEGLWYAGCHGFELLAPDGSTHIHDTAPGAERALADAAAELSSRLSDIPGIRVEHKRFAVAVHYRQADPTRVGAVISAVHELSRAHGLRVTGGRKVIELRPDIDWDKGTALHWILARLTDPRVPLYIGDDLTDEDAFDAVESTGFALVVGHDEDGDRPTAARYALADPTAVRVFLEKLASQLPEGAATGSV